MGQERENLKPVEGANRALRRRLDLTDALLLAFTLSVVILVVFALVEVFSKQRVLFASLATSAFLLYLDSQYGTNTVRTLFFSQMAAAVKGFVTYPHIRFEVGLRRGSYGLNDRNYDHL
jgi:ABC-type proline/glycine betaine transport system permease subunit